MMVFVFALFVFLVPIVPMTLNLCHPFSGCTPGLRQDFATVSISYYGFGLGGRIVTTSYSGHNTFQILFMPGWMCNKTITSSGTGVTCYQVMWPQS
jgi:hypothetical protein